MLFSVFGLRFSVFGKTWKHNRDKNLCTRTSLCCLLCRSGFFLRDGVSSTTIDAVLAGLLDRRLLGSHGLSAMRVVHAFSSFVSVRILFFCCACSWCLQQVSGSVSWLSWWRQMCYQRWHSCEFGCYGKEHDHFCSEAHEFT